MRAQLEILVSQMYRRGMGFEEALREFQGAFILTVLRDSKGNQCRAAKRLGMHRNTLRRTIRLRLSRKRVDRDLGSARRWRVRFGCQPK